MILQRTAAPALVAMFVVSSCASHAHAGELALGVAAGLRTTHYRDQEDQTFLVPVIVYEGERFSYFLDTAALQLVGGEVGRTGFRTRMIARARVFDEPHDRAGLEKRRSTLDAGLEFAAQGAWGSASLEAVADTLGRHEGFEVSLTYAYELQISEKLSIEPSVSVSYYDPNLADYYFGVRPSEVRWGRSAYGPEAGGVATHGLTAIYVLNTRWQLVGVLQHEVLSAELSNSPLIAHRSSTTVALGMLCRF